MNEGNDGTDDQRQKDEGHHDTDDHSLVSVIIILPTGIGIGGGGGCVVALGYGVICGVARPPRLGRRSGSFGVCVAAVAEAWLPRQWLCGRP